MEAKEIKLVQTCSACPEQYDAYYEDHEVGYLRLRHGNFTVECGIDLVYHAYPNGDGAFDDEIEREYHLHKAKQAICDYRNEIGI